MMKRRLAYLASAVAVLVPCLVCAQQPSPPPAAAARAANSDEVAARIGDRVITVGELDKAWQETDGPGHAQAVQALYDGRKEALDRLVADLLIEQAAKAKGMSAAQFTNEEVARRTKPIADADIEAFYTQNSGRMQGRPLDAMRPAIRNFLQQQRQAQARQALVNDLRKSGPELRIALDPPRQSVTVRDTDPSRGPANASVVLVEYSDYQ